MSEDAEATSQMEWFYEANGEQQGPASYEHVVNLIRSAGITRGTPVWRRGFADWVLVENSELAQYFANSKPPPLSGEHVDNTLTWVLAVAPLIGYVLEYIVADMLNANEFAADAAMDDAKYWFITLALNVGLSYMDEMRLKAAGHDTSKFGGMAWLVPVYLFQRAKFLKQSPAYFWIWIVCFVFILI